MKQFSKSVQSIYSIFNWEKKNAEHAKNASVRKTSPIFRNAGFTLSAVIVFLLLSSFQQMPSSTPSDEEDKMMSEPFVQDQTPAGEDMTLLAEGHGKAFYLRLDAPPGDDDFIGQYTLYVKHTPDGSLTPLFQTSPFGKQGTKLKIKKGDKYVEEGIEAIEEIILLSDSKILISGCPDARNIYSYIYDLPTGKIVFLDVYSGYVDTVEEDGRPLIKMSTYAYRPNGGGRYGIYVYFDMDGNKIRQENAPDDEDY